jgi:hypothetical protein
MERLWPNIAGKDKGAIPVIFFRISLKGSSGPEAYSLIKGNQPN